MSILKVHFMPTEADSILGFSRQEGRGVPGVVGVCGGVGGGGGVRVVGAADRRAAVDLLRVVHPVPMFKFKGKLRLGGEVEGEGEREGEGRLRATYIVKT
jgi:hypothetical protein